MPPGAFGILDPTKLIKQNLEITRFWNGKKNLLTLIFWVPAISFRMDLVSTLNPNQTWYFFCSSWIVVMEILDCCNGCGYGFPWQQSNIFRIIAPHPLPRARTHQETLEDLKMGDPGWREPFHWPGSCLQTPSKHWWNTQVFTTRGLKLWNQHRTSSLKKLVCFFLFQKFAESYEVGPKYNILWGFLESTQIGEEFRCPESWGKCWENLGWRGL